jgi:hypothetical protein
MNCRVPHTFAFFAEGWVLRAPLHSGIGIIFLKWLEYRAPRGVSVISTHCGRVETHSCISTEAVGRRPLHRSFASLRMTNL